MVGVYNHTNTNCRNYK